MRNIARSDTMAENGGRKPMTGLRLPDVETDDYLLLITGWKRDGLSNVDIAKKLGVSETTLQNWRKRSPKVDKALKIGREAANYMVENALMKNALKGNVTAQIYWLKNNYRSKYFETVAHELSKDDATVAGLKTLLSKLEGEIDGAK